MSATDDAVAAHSGTPRPQAGAFSLDRVIVIARQWPAGFAAERF
jgi:hypothetical protein